MSKNKYKNHCKICGNNLQKRGKTASGTQRYFCVNCNKSSIVEKENNTKRNELKMFVNWLLDKPTKSQSSNICRRTFNNKTKWCWDITPKIKYENIESEFLISDTTYLTKDVGLMVVRNGNYVLNYRWCESENYIDYFKLLKGLKEPKFLICDGSTPLIKSAMKLWKKLEIQRCLFHIGLNTKAKLGQRSPYPAVQELRKHILKISTINTIRKSKNWYKKFEDLCEKHKSFLNEKRVVDIDHDTGEILKEVRVHKKPYSMINMIRKAYKQNRLFLFLEHDIPNTTNYVEGGINSRIKELIRCHRGLCLEKQKKICEWYLASRSSQTIDEIITELLCEKY
jgi:hypothetical protein